MGRIPPDRVGYSGYACAGISQYVVDAQDCLGPNYYKQLPPLMKGPSSDFPWLDMSPIDDDIRLKAIVASCNVSFDPFYGTEVDLRQALVDHGFSSLMPADCYEADGRYATGFTNPHPFFPNCGCGTYVPGGIIPESSSASSASSASSSESYPIEGTCGITWYWSCDMETGWQEQGPYAKFCYDYTGSNWLCCEYGTCSGDPHPDGWDCVEYSMVYYTKLGTTCNEYDCTSNCSTLWAEDPPEEPTEEICPCVPPETGACCIDATCYADMTEDDCIWGGGEWQGPDTTCDPDPCAPPNVCMYVWEAHFECFEEREWEGPMLVDAYCTFECIEQPPNWYIEEIYPGSWRGTCWTCDEMAACMLNSDCIYPVDPPWPPWYTPVCPEGESACCFDGGWCDDTLTESQCYEYGGIAYYSGVPCAGGGGDECPF